MLKKLWPGGWIDEQRKFAPWSIFNVRRKMSRCQYCGLSKSQRLRSVDSCSPKICNWLQIFHQCFFRAVPKSSQRLSLFLPLLFFPLKAKLRKSRTKKWKRIKDVEPETYGPNCGLCSRAWRKLKKLSEILETFSYVSTGPSCSLQPQRQTWPECTVRLSLSLSLPATPFRKESFKKPSKWMRFSQDFLTFVEYWTQHRATTAEEEEEEEEAAALPEAARSAFKAKKTLVQFLLTPFL